MTAPALDRWERRLEREGLGALDYDDGDGGIRVGNRGSGKVLDATRAFARASRAAEMDQRRAILKGHRFSRNERKVYTLYADGKSVVAIARSTGLGRMAVWRTIGRIERGHRMAPEKRIDELLAGCEPSTIVLFFALLERALTEPAAVRAMIGKVRAVPEMRALLEPEIVKEE